MLRDKAVVYAILSVLEMAKRHRGDVAAGIPGDRVAETSGLASTYVGRVMVRMVRARILRVSLPKTPSSLMTKDLRDSPFEGASTMRLEPGDLPLSPLC